jgi:hypothetical protein
VPQEKICWQYVLRKEGGFIASKPLTSGDELTTPILPGFALDLTELFETT